MRKPTENVSVFAERRSEVVNRLKGSALVVASHPEYIRNHDVEHTYRQDSNLYYLTGFEEPESILLIRPGMKPETVMFVRKRDIEKETWNGFRFGPEGVEREFKIDKAYPIEEFEKQAVELLKGFDSIYYRLFKNHEADAKMQNVLESLRRSQGRTGYGLLAIHDADVLLGEMRLFKSEQEIHNLKVACEITSNAHIDAMRFTRPGVNERQVQAVLSQRFYKDGSARPGYNFIVASGASATTLHYNFNDQICKSGDLLLIDAGAEYNYYTSDITRTFPVSGKFSKPQLAIYEAVLRVQKKVIEYVKPGVTFKALQDMGTELLTEEMLELGFLSGKKEDIIKAGTHKKYYPHGIGHWLGMDVHDMGLYYIKDQPRSIEAGMVFTVEPGIYIPHDDTSVDPSFRGIGVRIEDNILVTRTGHENLTISCPKEVSDLENIVGRG